MVWKPKHDVAAKKKARKVARYYLASKAMMGYPPTNMAVGYRFGRSGTWARNYLRLARELGFLVDGD
jgi:hypothetical protein